VVAVLELAQLALVPALHDGEIAGDPGDVVDVPAAHGLGLDGGPVVLGDGLGAAADLDPVLLVADDDVPALFGEVVDVLLGAQFVLQFLQFHDDLRLYYFDFIYLLGHGMPCPYLLPRVVYHPLKMIQARGAEKKTKTIY